MNMKDLIEYRGFYGVVHFSSEDGCLYGKIVGVNDLVTFEGQSVSEIEQAFKDAVVDYISLCKEVGKKPLRSVKGSFNVRLDPETHLKALIKAEVEGYSLNKLIKHAVEKEVESISIPD